DPGRPALRLSRRRRGRTLALAAWVWGEQGQLHGDGALHHPALSPHHSRPHRLWRVLTSPGSRLRFTSPGRTAAGLYACARHQSLPPRWPLHGRTNLPHLYLSLCWRCGKPVVDRSRRCVERPKSERQRIVAEGRRNPLMARNEEEFVGVVSFVMNKPP